MYTKRIQIFHYGPIEDLDIEIPFNGDSPKPVVLVGANGSGKNVPCISEQERNGPLPESIIKMDYSQEN